VRNCSQGFNQLVQILGAAVIYPGLEIETRVYPCRCFKNVIVEFEDLDRDFADPAATDFELDVSDSPTVRERPINIRFFVLKSALALNISGARGIPVTCYQKKSLVHPFLTLLISSLNFLERWCQER
jgi:hypothetical protein